MIPTIAKKLDALAHRLSKVAQDIRDGIVDLETDTVQRMGVAQIGTDLIHAVSLPEDQVHLMAPMLTHATAIRLFIKWKAFEAIPKVDAAAISYTDLAAKLGGDVSLITRFARTLVANHTLKQTGTDKVTHTAFSRLLTTPQYRAVMELMFDDHLAACVAMPKYFDHFGLIEPLDRLQTPLAYAAGKLGSTVWDVYHSDEERLKTFMLSMTAVESWAPAQNDYNFDWVAKAAVRALDSDRVLLVDVGGGRGHALQRILDANPGIPPSRCALEDLPDVVEATRRNQVGLKDVQMIGMDFHQEQAIKNALVYHLRRCLHDYSDDESAEILRAIAGAMGSDSKLLIVELVISNPPSAYQASLDIMMMVISGKERTLETWQDIVARAGLMVTHISVGHGGSGVIECMLAAA